MATQCGVLLPLTTRAAAGKAAISVAAVLKRVKAVANNLSATCEAARLKVFVGVDKVDDELASEEAQEAIRAALGTAGLRNDISVLNFAVGHLCEIWQELATKAFEEGFKYTLLIGDDVHIDTPDWLRIVDDLYKALAEATFETAEQAALFRGFGCVAFTDTACPNFPSFPIVHRLHWEMHNKRMFPELFVNQDADPFIFHTYSRWNAAVIEPALVLTNAVGGHGDARYEKASVTAQCLILSAAAGEVLS
jgi:hypothetical protein